MFLWLKDLQYFSYIICLHMVFFFVIQMTKLFFYGAVLTWEEKNLTKIKPLKPYFISGKAPLSEMAAV